MKVSKRDIQLLIALFGILIAVGAYYFVYQKNVEKAEVLEAQNSTLEGELAKLKALNEHREEYESSTADMKVWMNSFERQFPADILPEDSIMMVKNMEDSTRTTVVSIAFGGEAEVAYSGAAGQTSSSDAQTINGTAIAAAAGAVTDNASLIVPDVTEYPDTRMFEVPLRISISSTYDDFKGLVQYIYNQQNRMCIKGVNIGYNEESGELSGNMTMGTYYLQGTDKQYVEPNIPGMGMGVDTIFGNID